MLCGYCLKSRLRFLNNKRAVSALAQIRPTELLLAPNQRCVASISKDPMRTRNAQISCKKKYDDIGCALVSCVRSRFVEWSSRKRAHKWSVEPVTRRAHRAFLERSALSLHVESVCGCCCCGARPDRQDNSEFFNRYSRTTGRQSAHSSKHRVHRQR